MSAHLADFGFLGDIDNSFVNNTFALIAQFKFPLFFSGVKNNFAVSWRRGLMIIYMWERKPHTPFYRPKPSSSPFSSLCYLNKLSRALQWRKYILVRGGNPNWDVVTSRAKHESRVQSPSLLCDWLLTEGLWEIFPIYSNRVSHLLKFLFTAKRLP